MCSKLWSTLEDFSEIDNEMPSSQTFSPLKSALQIAKNRLIPVGKFEVYKFSNLKTNFWFYAMDFLGTYFFVNFDGKRNFNDLQKALKIFAEKSKLFQEMRNSELLILWGDAEMVEKLKPHLLHSHNFSSSSDPHCFDCLNIIPCGAKFVEKPLGDGFFLDSLNEKDANFVASKWRYSAKDEAERIKHRIHDLPSICIRSKSDNSLIGWVMVDHRGMVQHLHVLPEYRGKGIRSILMEKIGEKVYENPMGIKPFYCVDEENDVMMKWIPKGHWVLNSSGAHQKILFTAIYPRK